MIYFLKLEKVSEVKYCSDQILSILKSFSQNFKITTITKIVRIYS